MKNKQKFNIFKVLIAFFILIPCIFAFSGCSYFNFGNNKEQSITISSDGYWVINGEKTDIKARGEDGKDGLNGKDGVIYQDYTIDEIYDAFLANGYDKDFETFFLEYFNLSLDIKAQTTNKCRPSVVSIVNNYSYDSPKRGSGVIIEKDANGNAYILTNFHVCYPKSQSTIFTIYLSSDEDKQSPILATYVAGSENYDLAVLRVTANETIKSASVANIATTNAKDGETCIAIGNPLSNGISITDGVVSVDLEQVSYNAGTGSKSRTVLRHNAYITKGSSGGGLFNLRGELIGITCAGEVGELDLMNYAVPISVINEFLNQIF